MKITKKVWVCIYKDMDDSVYFKKPTAREIKLDKYWGITTVEGTLTYSVDKK